MAEGSRPREDDLESKILVVSDTLTRDIRPKDLGIGKLLERIQDAVIVADAETHRILLWNMAATRIFGYSPSEAVELKVESLVPEPLKAWHRAGISRYAKTGHGPYVYSDEVLDLPAATLVAEVPLPAFGRKREVNHQR